MLPFVFLPRAAGSGAFWRPVARFLACRIPGARSPIVAGGTHAFAREMPDEVASHVRAHLEG